MLKSLRNWPQQPIGVATIGRIHRRLHSLDREQTFAFKQYIEDLCRDFSMMLSSDRPERVIVVEGIEIELPAVTAIPLGFIANELITNATKYGTGRITVRLEANPANGYALSVANEGQLCRRHLIQPPAKGWE